MRWYYASGNQQMGPVSDEQLQSLVSNGTVQANTLVWRDGMANWAPYQNAGLQQPPVERPQIPQQPAYGVDERGAAVALAPAVDHPLQTPSPANRFCSQCGRSFPLSEMVQFGSTYVCGYCKDAFAQQLREGGVATGARHFAGFWIRVAASILDAILMSMVQFLVILIPFGIMAGRAGAAGVFAQLAFWLFQLAVYEPWFIVQFGGTPGKLVCQLRVVRGDGGPMTYPLALGRSFAKVLSQLTLCIGYIMVGLDEEKRGLHDRICDTRVIYK